MEYTAITETGSHHYVNTTTKEYKRTNPAEPLRLDGEPIQLIDSWNPVVDQPLYLVLQIREDGVPTIRLTSPITEVIYHDQDTRRNP